MSGDWGQDGRPEEGPERRGAVRVDLFAIVSLRRAGSLSYRVRVHDLSQDGCKVEFVDRPSVAERVWVKLDSLEALSGTVRWVSRDTVGLQFDAPLHPAVFQMLTGRLRK